MVLAFHYQRRWLSRPARSGWATRARSTFVGLGSLANVVRAWVTSSSGRQGQSLGYLVNVKRLPVLGSPAPMGARSVRRAASSMACNLRTASGGRIASPVSARRAWIAVCTKIWRRPVGASHRAPSFTQSWCEGELAGPHGDKCVRVCRALPAANARGGRRACAGDLSRAAQRTALHGPRQLAAQRADTAGRRGTLRAPPLRRLGRETLGWKLRWDAELDAEYHRQSVYAPAKVLTLGNITCPAQQFWDAIVYAAPSEIPAALASI